MYEATIQSPNISRARTVQAKSLREIKSKATEEFRGERNEDTIAIFDLRPPHGPVCVSRRLVGEKVWQDSL